MGSHQKRLVMQVWSNEQAIQEYKDLLAGKAAQATEDGPSVIVGAGKLGTAIKVGGLAHQCDCAKCSRMGSFTVLAAGEA